MLELESTASPSGEPPSLSERVLVVEDDRATRLGLTELVRSWGYVAESAADGEEALQRITTFRPGIIVSDVVIDTVDLSVVGYEVLSADEPKQRKGRRSYLPLPETGAVSGEALIVPASAVDYIATDFAGFGEAIDRYRNMLRGTS